MSHAFVKAGDGEDTGMLNFNGASASQYTA